MSVYKCADEVRLRVFDYKPKESLLPCFVGEDNEYACFMTQHECGLDIAGLPENAETSPIIEMASKYASHSILSEDDLFKFVYIDRGATSIYDHFFDRNGGIRRFLKNAKEIINKYKP